jgi:hypothetical protein
LVVFVDAGGSWSPHQQFEFWSANTDAPKVRQGVPQAPLELNVYDPLRVKPVLDEKQPSGVMSPAATFEALKRAAAAARVKERTVFIVYDVMFNGRGLEDGDGPLDLN